MIFTTIGCLIIGGLANQYGMPYINDYFYSLESNNTNINIYCFKCNIPTDMEYSHCENCNRCHIETEYRQCNLCHDCININKYNIHTKTFCVHNFDNNNNII